MNSTGPNLYTTFLHALFTCASRKWSFTSSLLRTSASNRSGTSRISAPSSTPKSPSFESLIRLLLLGSMAAARVSSGGDIDGGCPRAFRDPRGFFWDVTRLCLPAVGSGRHRRRLRAREPRRVSRAWVRAESSGASLSGDHVGYAAGRDAVSNPPASAPTPHPRPRETPESRIQHGQIRTTCPRLVSDQPRSPSDA